MRIVLRPLPVVYACQGCPEFGQAAREAGACLERAGAAELIWLGEEREAWPTQRYPIFSLDACDKRCALHWLERHGVVPERSYVLPDRP
jgi:uncharacterized metal-binding protein